MKQLFYLYEHPDEQLKKPVFSYRDYVISLGEYRGTEGYQLSKRYWEDKFSKIPSGPQLPVKEAANFLLLTSMSSMKECWKIGELLRR
jgi:hypothetical protein